MFAREEGTHQGDPFRRGGTNQFFICGSANNTFSSAGEYSQLCSDVLSTSIFLPLSLVLLPSPSSSLSSSFSMEAMKLLDIVIFLSVYPWSYPRFVPKNKLNKRKETKTNKKRQRKQKPNKNNLAKKILFWRERSEFSHAELTVFCGVTLRTLSWPSALGYVGGYPSGFLYNTRITSLLSLKHTNPTLKWLPVSGFPASSESTMRELPVLTPL